MAELSAARAKGHNGGRPSKLSPDQVRAARRLYDEREHTVQQIGSIFAVSRTSIYRALRDKPGRRLAPAGGRPTRFDVDSPGSRAVVTRTGERLVTVLVTLAVPAEATRRTPPAWSPTLRSAPRSRSGPLPEWKRICRCRAV